MADPIAGSHLQLNEEVWLAETFSKMATPTTGLNLQLKEQLWLADTMQSHFGGALGHFCLLSQKRDPEAQVECKLAKISRRRRGVNIEVYTEHGPGDYNYLWNTSRKELHLETNNG